MSTLLEQALLILKSQLQTFANTETSIDKLNIAFGKEIDVNTLLNNWQSGDFSDFPEIEIVGQSSLNGAIGAYSIATNRIYLLDEFVATSNLDSLVSLLLEEYGHAVDASFNKSDAPGDEGAIFAALVTGQSLSETELSALKTENDHGLISLNGVDLAVEMANFNGSNTNDTLPLAEEDNSGDDYFSPGTGADSIDGGAGTDYLYLDNSSDIADTTVIYTDVNSGTITGGSNSGTIFLNIEQVYLKTGSGKDDINLSATTSPSQWTTEVYAGAGNDTVIGSITGNNLLSGENGNDSLQGGNSQDSLYGGNDNDTILALAGNDTWRSRE